jgi:hypothetical protein
LSTNSGGFIRFIASIGFIDSIDLIESS